MGIPGHIARVIRQNYRLKEKLKKITFTPRQIQMLITQTQNMIDSTDDHVVLRLMKSANEKLMAMQPRKK